jgi:hypothetical protein
MLIDIDHVEAPQVTPAVISKWHPWRVTQPGKEAQGRTVLHPDLRVLGQPGRSPLRTTAAVHHRQLPPPQPHRADPALHAYLGWRNANTRHRDVLAAERKERARVRSEKGTRRGGRPLEISA